MSNYAENQSFIKQNFTELPLPIGVYELCTFSGCNFNNSNLASIKFVDCTFSDCDLSLSDINNTAFRNVKFTSCKMLGLNFENSNNLGFEVSFKNCQLNHCSFYKTRLTGTIFEDSTLIEADFTESNLQKSTFKNSELSGAIFNFTNLEKADFTTAQNYIIDPEINKMKKARFSIYGIQGLLTKYNIEVE